ncbi:TPA: ferric-rhodotorulic acid/ferric-coprogen receptor FhuE [Serratia odorifera]|nr:ferric-rhodotorulic acid/ferric-coprogen receptor FhuE [Serratia odorifera]
MSFAASCLRGNHACGFRPSAVGGFTRSSLALLVAACCFAPVAMAAENEDTIVVDGAANGSGLPEQDYAVPVTRAGTKMALTPRDIPQSVSVITQQRMQDQDLQTIGDVLSNTTGISANNIDSDRSTYFSRGFFINNYLYDDIPTTVDEVWNFGDAAGDTAIYQRIEVVRGANGLMTGSGNPSAAINMVRKHADSRELTGNLSASYGRWNKQRYVGDVSTPLNADGSVRGRAVAGYQDGDGWLDRYGNRKKFLYTALDADLTDSTKLSLGWEYQQSHTSNPTWGGLPTWYSDGSRTHYDRSFNPAPDWAYSDKESNKLFADLTQRFDNGWQARVNATHAKTTFDSKLMYASGYPDKITGDGVMAYGGWNKGTRKLDSLDAYASGPFELFGRQHELVAGGSYSKQNNYYFNSQSMLSTADVGDYNQWDGNVTQGSWSPWVVYADDTLRQKSFYGAVRFSLADPLSLIIGARYTDWRANGTTATSSKDAVTPYAGLIYDINDTYSAYISYTEIFQPQTVRDANRNYLDPTTGKNYEAGVKGDWHNSRLTASLSVFRTEQDNLGVSTGTYIPGTAEMAYESISGTVSRGVEFEVNGALTDNWQMTFGASRFVAEDKDGKAVNPFMPRTTLKLFSSYRVPTLQALTLGGGVNWQNHTWRDDAGPAGASRPEQGSYALVNLLARYQVNQQFSLQANVNNLFDKEYYDYLGSYAVYGAPRSVSVTANYQF